MIEQQIKIYRKNSRLNYFRCTKYKQQQEYLEPSLETVVDKD